MSNQPDRLRPYQGDHPGKWSNSSSSSWWLPVHWVVLLANG